MQAGDGIGEQKRGSRGQEGGRCPTPRGDGVPSMHVCNTKTGVLNVYIFYVKHTSAKLSKF